MVAGLPVWQHQVCSASERAPTLGTRRAMTIGRASLLDQATRRTRCLKEPRPQAVSCRTRRGLLVSHLRGVLADVTGFMGDSSGAAFYSALMELLQPMFPHANLMPPHPANSYQTWDSRPLPLSLASPYALPPQHLTRHLVSVFLQHCSGLFTFIYPADLDNQVNILYSLPPNTMQEIADPSSHITSSICQLYAVLAIASAHLPGLLPTSDLDRQALVNFDSGEPDFPGMAFFARAYLLLPSLVQDASVRSITTLALVVSTEKASRSVCLTMRRHTISCRYHTETLPTATSEPPSVYPSRWGCIIRPPRRSGRCSGPLSCSTGRFRDLMLRDHLNLQTG